MKCSLNRFLLVTVVFIIVAGCATLSPLMKAASKGDTKKVQALLAKGADVNAKNQWGYSPLNEAAYGGHTETAELLISKGADVNASGNWGFSPLHEAAYGGHTETAALLLSKGADVNARNEWGSSPLHRAAYGGHTETAELLISKGADVNAKTFYIPPKRIDIHSSRRTPTYGIWEPSMIRARHLMEVVAVMHLHWRYPSLSFLFLAPQLTVEETPLHEAAYGGHTETAALLLSKGAHVNAKTKLFGATPLHYAAYKSDDLAGAYTETAELLISKGADVNARGEIAISYKGIDCDWISRKYKLERRQTNLIKGETPLDFAKLFRSQESVNKEMIKLLKRHGAINTEGFGYTAPKIMYNFFYRWRDLRHTRKIRK